MTSSGCAKSSDTTMANAPGTNATAADTGKHDCKGKNTCKGQGGCKTGDNGCKGKNSCSGKGGCKTNVKSRIGLLFASSYHQAWRAESRTVPPRANR
jgi:hypothetical protein